MQHGFFKCFVSVNQGLPAEGSEGLGFDAEWSLNGTRLEKIWMVANLSELHDDVHDGNNVSRAEVFNGAEWANLTVLRVNSIKRYLLSSMNWL